MNTNEPLLQCTFLNIVSCVLSTVLMVKSIIFNSFIVLNADKEIKEKHKCYGSSVA